MRVRRRITGLISGLMALAAAPCVNAEAISRPLTVFNLPDVPPPPVVEAISRPITVFNLPDVPPPPIVQAVSRPITVFNLPDVPPGPNTEAVSRPITVRSDPATAAPGPSLPQHATLRGLHPNPFTGRTTVRFAMPALMRVTISVYDLSGRLVRTLLEAPMPAGDGSVDWDGRDARGRTVASGTYMVRMVTQEGAQVRKVILAR